MLPRGSSACSRGRAPRIAALRGNGAQSRRAGQAPATAIEQGARPTGYAVAPPVRAGMQKRACRPASPAAVGFGHDLVFWERPRWIDFCYDAIAVSVTRCLLMIYRCCFKSRTTTRDSRRAYRLFADGLSAQPLPVVPAPSQRVE